MKVTMSGRSYIGVEAEFMAYLDPAAGMAIRLHQGWELLTTVTTNISAYGYRPKAGCVFLKNYSENTNVLDSLVASGVVEETGLVVTQGRVQFPEVRIIGDWLVQYQEAEKDARRRRIEMLRSIK
jgi:hypothetical protein